MVSDNPNAQGSWDEYELPKAEGSKSFSKAWWVSAPWAHPVWKTYVIILYDLFTPIQGQPDPIIYMRGATHEIIVYALDPARPHNVWPPAILSPANHGYQFVANNHRLAGERISNLVQSISDRQVNPDTDARQQWDALFSDGVSLTMSAHQKGTKH